MSREIQVSYRISHPREVKRYLNAYTITMKINPTLEPDAVLAVLTLGFREDWSQCEEALILNGSVFVDALKRLLAREATAFDDIGLDLRPPDDFVAYTGAGQPGYALTQVPTSSATSPTSGERG